MSYAPSHLKAFEIKTLLVLYGYTDGACWLKRWSAYGLETYQEGGQ